MANEMDEVLLSDPNDSEFSGFGLDDLEPRSGSVTVKSKKDKKGKQPAKASQSVTAKTSKSSKNNKSKMPTMSAEQPPTSDQQTGRSFTELIDSLSEGEIIKLRTALGIASYDYADDEDIENVFGDSLANLPNLHVQVTESDEEQVSVPKSGKSGKKPKRAPLQPAELTKNFIDSMFESSSEADSGPEKLDNDSWGLPKVKGPVKGPAIASSLAEFINITCTSPCVTDDIINKHKIPENCDKLRSPTVNNEIWKIMNKRAQSYDKCFADIQNLVATGVVPIIKLFELLKPQIAGNSEIKTLFSDTITMMGQVQYNLSLRRRYMIKPHLKKKYQNLCHVSMPISTKLFGDDVTKDVKNCDTGVSLAKDSYPGFYGYNKPFRARGGYSRGVYSRGSRGGFRYQPYPQNMHYGGMYRSDYGMFPRGYPRQRFGQVRGKKQVAATVTTSAPNETA